MWEKVRRSITYRVNSNSKFANIKVIKQAQIKEDDHKIEENYFIISINSDFTVNYIQVQN